MGVWYIRQSFSIRLLTSAIGHICSVVKLIGISIRLCPETESQCFSNRLTASNVRVKNITCCTVRQKQLNHVSKVFFHVVTKNTDVLAGDWNTFTCFHPPLLGNVRIVESESELESDRRLGRVTDNLWYFRSLTCQSIINSDERGVRILLKVVASLSNMG